MATLTIQTQYWNVTVPISDQVYRMPDSSILAFIQETLHLNLPSRVSLERWATTGGGTVIVKQVGAW